MDYQFCGNFIACDLMQTVGILFHEDLIQVVVI
jgi:hypothetical protein